MKNATGRRLLALALLLTSLLSVATAQAREVLLRAGGSFGIAVDAAGTIWGWGDGRSGQLGYGGHALRTQPVTAAEGLDGNDVADIQCGNVSTLFLMKDGTVYTCGSNGFGQQGQAGDGKNNVMVPAQIPGLEGIQQVACGFGQCLALTTDGRVYAWGRNQSGQAGVGETRSVPAPELLALTDIVQIACGGKFCLALDAAGTLWGWGANDYGQLMGASQGGRNVLAPAKLETTLRFTQIACGSCAAYGIAEDGVLWAWGRNDFWQLGNDAVGSSTATPVQVDFAQEIRVDHVCAYSSHVAAITADGALWQWGSAYEGQLGIGKRITRVLPAQASPETGVTDACVGSLQSYVLLDSGLVLSSGFNKYGQSGAYKSGPQIITTWTSTGLNLLTGAWEEPGNK